MKRNILLPLWCGCVAAGVLLVFILFGLGADSLTYFTVLSNLYMGLSSLMYVVLWFVKKGKVPLWMALVQFSAVSAVTLTMLTVFFFLIPTNCEEGFPWWLLTDFNLCYHVVIPALSIAGFILLEKDHIIPPKYYFIGALPCLAYSLVYITAVVFLKCWKDFYGFTFGGIYALIPVAVLVMNGAAYGIALVLAKLHNRGMIKITGLRS